MRIDIVLKAIKFNSFPSTTTTTTTTTTATTCLLFSLHHHHHISIVFPPPPPPPPPPTHFYCFPSTTTTTTTTFSLFSSTTITATTFPLFFSTTVNKRLQTTIISSVCRNVSSCQEQPWFSSIFSCFSSSSMTVSFTDSQSTTTTCISPTLIQYT